jgi:hypothetical protein
MFLPVVISSQPALSAVLSRELFTLLLKCHHFFRAAKHRLDKLLRFWRLRNSMRRFLPSRAGEDLYLIFIKHGTKGDLYISLFLLLASNLSLV